MKITGDSAMQKLLDYLSLDSKGEIPNKTATNLLSRTANKDIGNYLIDIANNKSLLNDLIKNSYIHQLGFEKYILLLGSSKDSFSLRLHYWQRNPVTPFEGEIHNHCHNFTSKVLFGSLLHTFYKLDQNSDKLSLFEYSIDPRTHTSTQHFIRKTGAVVLNKCEVCSGQVYSLSSDILHSVDVGSECAVSLLIQGRQVTPGATVLKSNEQSKSEYRSVGIGKMTRKQIACRLSYIAELLGYV